MYQRIEKIWDTPEYRKAVKRTGGMSVHDILSWADIAGTQMSKVFYDYSNERDESVRRQMLDELRIAISSMQAATEKLMELEFVLE